MESLFRSEAIKTENPATVQCDAFQIEVFSQQDAPLSVPAISFLLVAVASRICQFVFGEFFSSLNAFSAGRQLEQGRRRSFH